VFLFSGGSSAAPLGAHLGRQASRSGGYGLVDILVILGMTAVGYWTFLAGIAQNWHLRPLGLRFRGDLLRPSSPDEPAIR